MNWLDLVILLTLVWFTLAGATAGLPREALTLASMLLGVVLAGQLHAGLADDFEVVFSNPRAAQAASFAAVFFAVYGAGQIAAVLLKNAALTLTFGPLHHTGGFVLGLIKGIVIIEAALFVFARYHLETVVGAMDGSLLTPFFLNGVPFVLILLPEEFRRSVDAFPAPI